LLVQFSLAVTPPPSLVQPAFKDSITLRPARTGHSGVPEASSGYPTSPPYSGGGRRNGAAASHGKGASRIIAKECERLLCRDMNRIFLGGGNNPKSVPVPMISVNSGKNNNHYSNGVDTKEMQFIEVWDYVGGASFRGFIAEKGVEKSLFLFFEHVEGTQLKHGLIALIELASECFNCDRLVICLDRKTDRIHSLIRDLGWVGFELITLSHWLQQDNIASPQAMASIVFPPTPPSSYSSTNARSGSFSSVSSTTSSVADEEVTSDQWIFVGMEL